MSEIARRFEAALAKLGPFEASPHIAVAVSGGSDSMALCLLADAWCRRHGGHVTALTIDHGLRPGSAAEVETVKTWLTARGIAHAGLAWTHATPSSAVQAKARAARYRLLQAWCREHGALHLLVGHTLEDQAETFFMRLRRGSGPDGLSGMSAVREMQHCRLLRPLLGIGRAELRDFLEFTGQDWIEDPSNLDRSFERVRVRGHLSSQAMPPKPLVDAAARYAAVRVVADNAADRFLARNCRMDPGGFAWLNCKALGEAEEDTGIRVLSRLLTAMGGGTYPPPRNKVEALFDALRQDTTVSRTLGGAHVVARNDRLLICREARNLPSRIDVLPGVEFSWDGRFQVARPKALRLGGQVCRLHTYKDVPPSKDLRSTAIGRILARVPTPAHGALPVIEDAYGVFSIPILDYKYLTITDGDENREDNPGAGVSIRFQPRRAVSLAGFCIA